jgi:hypothetical protein
MLATGVEEKAGAAIMLVGTAVLTEALSTGAIGAAVIVAGGIPVSEFALGAGATGTGAWEI